MTQSTVNPWHQFYGLYAVPLLKPPFQAGFRAILRSVWRVFRSGKSDWLQSSLHDDEGLRLDCFECAVDGVAR